MLSETEARKTEELLQAAISEMSEDEVKVLLKSLNNLSKFFHSYDNE